MRRVLATLLSIFLTVPSWAGFTAPGANDHCYGQVTTGTTFSCTNTTAPAAGAVVFVHVLTFTGLTLSSVKDANNNNLTLHGCSSTNDSQAGDSCLASYISPGGLASGQFTATVTGGTCGACSIDVNTFLVSGGTASFDKKDTTGNGTDAITTPTISPAGTGELFFATCTDENTCTAVTGSWTLGANGLGTFFEASEYQLSVGTSQSAGFSGSATLHYDSTIGAYSFTPTGGATFPAALINNPCQY